MNILIGLIPALFWGLMPIVVTKFGGKPVSQLMGTVYGCLIVGLISYAIIRPDISIMTFIWCFIAGAGWSIYSVLCFSEGWGLDHVSDVYRNATNWDHDRGCLIFRLLANG
ncbi:hypothetical protein HGK75_05470 [uncultured bacterium]|nr:GRP family sugar transporter [Acetilactobacillus jinshanensis]URL61437.1 hypothetical protein HGK75_05470 [uncultured bacterium]